MVVMCNLIVRTPKNTYIYKHKDDNVDGNGGWNGKGGGNINKP